MKLRIFVCSMVLLGSFGRLPAQEPVDYRSQVQPIFTETCSGGFCHIESGTSGVDVTDYPRTVASFGVQYELPIITAGDPDSSPLWDKISRDKPDWGQQMPRGAPPLSAEQQELIRRWIEEGANPFTQMFQRGDADSSGAINITDGIYVLGFLFLGTEEPFCIPAADATGDGQLNITDPVFILNFLFLGGPRPDPLTYAEQLSCNEANREPRAEPIGTITGREGLPLEFQVVASDLDDDPLEFEMILAPEGLTIDSSTGLVGWTPRFGQAGDHRIRVRVSDKRGLSVDTTGLVRIEEGNHPPAILTSGVFYGREGVLLGLSIVAEDDDGDVLRYELRDGPEEASITAATGLFLWRPSVGEAGEYTLSFIVSDDGEPSQSTSVDLQFIILEADSPVNQAPRIPSRDIYRTYPGYAIRIPIGASDPDGHFLTYSAEQLPEGAALDSETGIFTWTPTVDQLGPLYIPFEVTDQGLPPQTSEGRLVFKVNPPDTCVILDCDPEDGCETQLQPLGFSCCQGDPEVRVAEPVADCPDGRVLFVGRNRVGFGRMRNCDRLQVVPFGQGGSIIRFHVEARCVSSDFTVLIRARLETEDFLVFDSQRSTLMTERNDGYYQRLSLSFSSSREVSPVLLSGENAILTVSIEDFDGIIETQLRVRLTLSDLDDLPEPDVEDVPSGEAGCVGCHRPLDLNGERHGVEVAHPWFQLSCTECHGGDALATTRELAHVESAPGQSFIRNLSYDELGEVSLDYLQFINPGDLRVASRGCGSGNPANPGTGCHESLVDRVNKSVMATFVGHYKLPRYLAGSQDRTAIYGAVDVVDDDFDAATAPEGAVASLTALRGPDPDAERGSMSSCFDSYLPKSCPTCHLSDFGPNNDPGKYRSSGCTACHMQYSDSGLSVSEDPTISKDFPPHPKTHQLTSAISVEQCDHCHFQGGRVGLSYRGIREGGFAPDQTPPNAVPVDREVYGHEVGYYFVDEDDTNDYDETPPDLHFDAGMVCADCHIGGDVHGDGNLYTSERYQVGVSCEDCHGTVRSTIVADPIDGSFKNFKGDTYRRIRHTEDDRYLLRLLKDGRELEIPQVYTILASGQNQAMEEAMGVNDKGFSHTDKMECYVCHTSWRATCLGCHITLDDRGTTRNHTTGQDTLGVFQATRDAYLLDFFPLGMNHKGKISTLCSSMSIFVSYIDENGVQQYEDRVRTSSDGLKGFGWNPFHHHTVSRVPQNCDRCHPVAEGAGPDNTDLLRESYGFGAGRVVVPDGDGVFHDLTAFLDENGVLTSDFPHLGTGPIPADVRERALSIEVVPHPRQDP